MTSKETQRATDAGMRALAAFEAMGGIECECGLSRCQGCLATRVKRECAMALADAGWLPPEVHRKASDALKQIEPWLAKLAEYLPPEVVGHGRIFERVLARTRQAIKEVDLD